MRKIIFLTLFCCSFSYSQFTFYKPYEVEVVSNLPYEKLETRVEQTRLAFEAQEWSVEVLKYLLYRMRQEPFISGNQKIKLTINDTYGSRKIEVMIPVSEEIIQAFKTEEGFNERYIDFLSDTYEWILDMI